MDPDLLPDSLYTTAQVRELDRLAIEEEGIPGLTLMRRAAQACLETIEATWARTKTVTVFCGSGNNAGDGYILAGMLTERGRDVQVVVVGDPDKLGDDASAAWEYCRASGARIETFEAETRVTGELLIDALLGTGLSGEVRERYRHAIERINDSGHPVVSIDIPSGLSADTGSELGAAVRATATVTFIGIKRGLLTNQGPEAVGRLIFARLGVPDTVYAGVPADTIKLARDRNLPRLPRRRRNAHKGDFGHVLIVGGDAGMGGAVAMAGEAALRTGAGLVSIATHPVHAGNMIARRPELMIRGVESPAAVEPLLARATTLVLGPGLGTSDWSRAMFDRMMEAGLPMIVDADGLNLLSSRDMSRQDWILTPHPGEASRLLEGADVVSDRFYAVRELQARYGGVVLLKGAGTLICGGDRILLCPWGNPGMSTAGMGDILSGILGGLRAQGLGLEGAAALGAAVHAMAGDLEAEKKGEHGMIATDLIPVVRQLLNECH